mmetsp:Transcript_14191/g.34423  ORF Transcript_14191/g.34423 Transcript_14191/m.34423 type:complete len:222 (+) Transcript_14191:819-1484(+)
MPCVVPSLATSSPARIIISLTKTRAGRSGSISLVVTSIADASNARTALAAFRPRFFNLSSVETVGAAMTLPSQFSLSSTAAWSSARGVTLISASGIVIVIAPLSTLYRARRSAASCSSASPGCSPAEVRSVSLACSSVIQCVVRTVLGPIQYSSTCPSWLSVAVIDSAHRVSPLTRLMPCVARSRGNIDTIPVGVYPDVARRRASSSSGLPRRTNRVASAT